MRSPVTNTGCINCGGPLFIREGSRRVNCPWCKKTLLIHTPDFVSRYTVPCQTHPGQIRHRIKQALHRTEIPKSAQVAASKSSPQLYYVPFYELDARLMGQMRVKISEQRKRMGHIKRKGNVVHYFDENNNEIDHDAYYKLQQVIEYDTRVRMHEIYKTCPATKLQGWGLEHVQISALRNQGLELLPYNIEDIQSKAIVFSVDVPRETLKQQMEHEHSKSQFNWYVEIGDQRLQVLYYPIWRLRFIDEGRGYSLSVSGVSGQILDGSAPENHVRGAMAMVLAGACIGLPLSFLLKTPSAISVLGSLLLNPMGIIMGLSIMIPILTGLGLAWADFRYRGEVHFSNGNARVVRLNLPPKTNIDRLVDALSRLTQSLISTSEDAGWKTR